MKLIKLQQQTAKNNILAY